MDGYQTELLWIVIIGFIIAFFLAFAIGANDVANSFGTSIGSNVLTFKQVCILATIFEISGSILLGSKVSDTIRKGIIDPNMFTEKELLIGNLVTLASSFIWIIIATVLKLPVSGTHSIIGSIIGFSILATGINGIKWEVFGKIVVSWVISPLFSGFISVILFVFIRKIILNNSNPLKQGLKWLPIFYAIVVMINVTAILLSAPPLLYFDHIPWWGIIIIICGIGLIVGLCIWLIVVPRKRKQIMKQFNENILLEQITEQQNILLTDVSIENAENPIENPIITSEHDENPIITIEHDENPIENPIITIEHDENPIEIRIISIKNDEKPELVSIFSFLQILTAIFGSFAHGGNDVSNAIGPLISIWIIWTSGIIEQQVDTPIWILFFGGVGMSIGLCVYGKQVIKTIGNNLTKITPSSGFVIEIASAMTVLLASNLSIPISTTHCKVGSVVFTGLIRSKTSVSWSLFRSIIIAWFVTVPVSAAISAGLYFLIISYIEIN